MTKVDWYFTMLFAESTSSIKAEAARLCLFCSIMNMAFCSSCKKERDDDDFIRRSRFGGRNKYCRNCIDKQSKRTARYREKRAMQAVDEKT